MAAHNLETTYWRLDRIEEKQIGISTSSRLYLNMLHSSLYFYFHRVPLPASSSQERTNEKKSGFGNDPTVTVLSKCEIKQTLHWKKGHFKLNNVCQDNTNGTKTSVTDYLFWLFWKMNFPPSSALCSVLGIWGFQIPEWDELHLEYHYDQTLHQMPGDIFTQKKTTPLVTCLSKSLIF